MVKGTINSILTIVSLPSASRLESQLPEKTDDKPESHLSDVTVNVFAYPLPLLFWFYKI